MPSTKYDRSVYGITPPRELKDKDYAASLQCGETRNTTINSRAPINLDPESISSVG